MSELERKAAVLTILSAGKMKRLDEDDLAALAELAEEDGKTLAELGKSKV